MQETWIRSPGWEDPLVEDMATHSNILAWRIPMDRGAWQATYSSWSWRVRHDGVTKHTQSLYIRYGLCGSFFHTTQPLQGVQFGGLSENLNLTVFCHHFHNPVVISCYCGAKMLDNFLTYYFLENTGFSQIYLLTPSSSYTHWLLDLYVCPRVGVEGTSHIHSWPLTLYITLTSDLLTSPLLSFLYLFV